MCFRRIATPFCQGGRRAFLMLVVAALGTPAHAGAPPDAVISALDTTGMAPFTANVHAMDSLFGTGAATSSYIEWDFGDEQGSYNQLVGFNAAHVYDEPGVYLVTLRITNEAGLVDTGSIVINVQPDTRSTLYVAANGSDGNPGHSPSQPLRTLNRALDLQAPATKILLRRGDTFDHGSGVIDNPSVLIGAYGSGARPRLRYVGSPGYTTMLYVDYNVADNTVIQDLHFDSVHDAGAIRNIADGISPQSLNTTIRGCHFSDISLGINCNREPVGVMAVGNTSDVIAAYFSWAQGTDHVYVGNTVAGSTFEHNLRLANTNRVLIAHNDLTAAPKCQVWTMLGEYAYVHRNIFHSASLCVGPDPNSWGPAGRFKHAVFEENEILKDQGINGAMNVSAGTEDLIIRNNVFEVQWRPCIIVDGYDAAQDRTTRDIAVLNNTGITAAEDANFLVVRDGAEGVSVVNNLYSAPNLATGENLTANVYVASDDLDSFDLITGNVWAIPDHFEWIPDAYHYVWPYWSDAEGYKSPDEWAAFPEVSREEYEIVHLDGAYAPPAGSIAATHGLPHGAVHTDFYGNWRPADAAWSVGAIDLGAGAPTDPPDPCVPDTDGDGTVGFGDLVLVLDEWGGCPPVWGCSTDLDGSGAVDFLDVIGLLQEWGPCP